MDKKSLTTDWIYYSPSFEFIKELPLESSAWSGHYFFAYDLVRNVKPRVIVELGTHKGNSLFSMAQAIKDEKLKTELHGIDTWEGDPQAGYYGKDVYNQFLNISKKYYKDVNISPHKMFFDDAVEEFKDNSVDILHIDGLHTYDAVKHDFETWLPKVKKDTGIIIFHDVCETKDDFGVYKLWKDLKKKYKNTITFEHYHGLGVVFLNKNLPQFLNYYYFTLSNNHDLIYSIDQLEIQFKKEKQINNGLRKDLQESQKETEIYRKEAEEFRAFKKGMIWKTLSKYRTIKNRKKKINEKQS